VVPFKSENQFNIVSLFISNLTVIRKVAPLEVNFFDSSIILIKGLFISATIDSIHIENLKVGRKSLVSIYAVSDLSLDPKYEINIKDIQMYSEYIHIELIVP
jgi:hypothetical protein